MANGTVKWFNSQKGFGFIQPESGEKDVFVHISAVERAGMRGLNEGQAIAYDLETDTREKARNIQAAIAAAAVDLGFAVEEIVPVSLADPEAPYNVERLWQRIAAALPEATRAQLLRCLHDLRDSWTWRSVWSQAAGAGRTIAGALKEVSRGGRDT